MVPKWDPFSICPRRWTSWSLMLVAAPFYPSPFSQKEGKKKVERAKVEKGTARRRNLERLPRDTLLSKSPTWQERRKGLCEIIDNAAAACPLSRRNL